MSSTNFCASTLTMSGGGFSSSEDSSGFDLAFLVVPGEGSFLSSFANELGVAFLFTNLTSTLALTCSNACPKHDPKQFPPSVFSSQSSGEFLRLLSV